MNPAALEEIRDLAGEERIHDFFGGLSDDLLGRFTRLRERSRISVPHAPSNRVEWD